MEVCDIACTIPVSLKIKQHDHTAFCNNYWLFNIQLPVCVFIMSLKGTLYNEWAIRQNASMVDYCRTSTAAVAGATAGILGLTGLYGFAFFFVYSFILSILLAFKAGSNWTNYFTSRRQIWFDGMIGIGGLFTYVLLWTFLYGMVHVY